jgi:hypothetical protein
MIVSVSDYLDVEAHRTVARNHCKPGNAQAARHHPCMQGTFASALLLAAPSCTRLWNYASTSFHHLFEVASLSSCNDPKNVSFKTLEFHPALQDAQVNCLSIATCWPVVKRRAHDGFSTLS